MNSKWLATAALIAFVGCGGGGKQATPETAAGEPQVSPPEKAWEQMSFKARKDYMMSKVLPIMKDKFTSFDSEEFAGFNCKTCHGEDARAREFEMPSPDLPALPPTGSPAQKQMVDEHPKMVKFMFNDVVPDMQTMLGAKPYNEETGEGFSCFSCHPQAGTEGTELVEGVEPVEGTGEGEGAEPAEGTGDGEGAEPADGTEDGEQGEMEGADEGGDSAVQDDSETTAEDTRAQ